MKKLLLMLTLIGVVTSIQARKHNKDDDQKEMKHKESKGKKCKNKECKDNKNKKTGNKDKTNNKKNKKKGKDKKEKKNDNGAQSIKIQRCKQKEKELDPTKPKKQ